MPAADKPQDAAMLEPEPTAYGVLPISKRRQRFAPKSSRLLNTRKKNSLLCLISKKWPRSFRKRLYGKSLCPKSLPRLLKSQHRKSLSPRHFPGTRRYLYPQKTQLLPRRPGVPWKWILLQ